MSWTEKDLIRLKKENKISGYTIPEKKKNYSGNNQVIIPLPKPKGVIWLELNLLYWGNERTIGLEREHKFSIDRGWRFDFAFPALKIAVEYEGIYTTGMSRHTSMKGYNGDLDKYNAATGLGWRVIRVTAKNYTTVLKTLNELVYGLK